MKISLCESMMGVQILLLNIRCLHIMTKVIIIIHNINGSYVCKAL